MKPKRKRKQIGDVRKVITPIVIQKIRHPETQGIETIIDSRLRGNDKTVPCVLDTLNAAEKIKDMNYPGSALHQLEPKKENIWAVKVSGNWRVTFRFENGDAYVVDYLDYH